MNRPYGGVLSGQAVRERLVHLVVTAWVIVLYHLLSNMFVTGSSVLSLSKSKRL